MTLSIENLARIMSAHYEKAKALEKDFNSLRVHIQRLRDDIDALEACIEDIEPVQGVEDLAGELMGEMTVEDGQNFIRLSGIE